MPAAAMALAVIISRYYFIVIVAQLIRGQREGQGCGGCREKKETGQPRGESLGSSGIWLRFNLRGSLA